VSAPQPAFAFVKAEGLGNDFLIVDGRGAALDALAARLQPLTRAICDRHRGVGADGLLLVGDATGPGADVTMRVINADGSRPQMCGNGLRCVALWLARSEGRDTWCVDTDAGPRRCRVIDSPDGADIDVDMGAVVHGEPVVLTPTGGAARSFARVSMGNPHAVAFVAEGEDPEGLARGLGPLLERDPVFPEGTNVEFARIERDAVTLWVWERGCGITDACGTGACATAAAAVATGQLPAGQPLVVTLPGGPLWITVPRDPGEPVRMRGPARLVFTGRWPA